MNAHRRFHEMLARRAELSTGEEQQLRAHLATCAECRETAAAYEQQWQLLRAIPPLQPPPALRAAVLARIHAAPPPAVPWYRRRPVMLAPLAAAVLALVAVVWVAGSHVIAQPGSRTALSAQTATPTAPAGAGGSAPFAASATPRTVAPAVRPGHTVTSGALHPVPAAHPRGRTVQRARSAPTAVPASVPTVPLAGPRVTATPVFSGSNPSVAIGPPPTRVAPTVVRPAVKRGAGSAASRAGARPPATPVPTATSGPVGIAVGPPPGVAPAPPSRVAPVRPTPAPAVSAPATPTPAPVILVTPVTVSTPLPIVPPVATPTPAALIFSPVITPTPTRTATATATPRP